MGLLLRDGPSPYVVGLFIFLIAWRLVPFLIQRLRGKQEAQGYDKVAAALDRNTEAIGEMMTLLQEVALIAGYRLNGADPPASPTNGHAAAPLPLGSPELPRNPPS